MASGASGIHCLLSVFWYGLRWQRPLIILPRLWVGSGLRSQEACPRSVRSLPVGLSRASAPFLPSGLRWDSWFSEGWFCYLAFASHVAEDALCQVTRSRWKLYSVASLSSGENRKQPQLVSCA